MATVNPTFVDHGSDTKLVTWTLTSADSDGAPIGPTLELYADRTVQFTSGAWGGATAVLQGSNDGTNWSTLTDPWNNGISYTTGASNMDAVTEIPLFVRPNLTTPGSGATVVVRLCMRRPRIVGR